MANIDPSTLKKSISPWIEARHVLTDVLIVVIKSSYYIGVVVIIKKTFLPHTYEARGTRFHTFCYHVCEGSTEESKISSDFAP